MSGYTRAFNYLEFAQKLRDVLGQGSDISPENPFQVFDAAVSPANGTTSAGGNVAGTTVVDTTRKEPDNFWNGVALLITSGDYAGQMREITGWALATGTFTVSPSFGGQIVAGVTYKILATMPAAVNVAEILSDVDTLLLRKFDYLTNMKALFFKRAETLGTDGGSAEFTATHGNRAEDEPLYSRLGTPAGIGSYVSSYGDHDIARASRMAWDGVGGKLVFEARVRVEQVAAFGIGLGLGRAISGAESMFRAATFWHDTEIGPNWRACSCDGVDHDYNTDTLVSVDTSWHLFRIEVTSETKFYIDGVLKATHTSYYTPNAGLPDWIYRTFVHATAREAVSKYCRYEYVAVWNEPL